MTPFVIAPRGNGKSVLGIPFALGIPFDELEAVAARYHPTLERLGVLEDLSASERMFLFIWLWKHDKEKETHGRQGDDDHHVRYRRALDSR